MHFIVTCILLVGSHPASAQPAARFSLVSALAGAEPGWAGSSKINK